MPRAKTPVTPLKYTPPVEVDGKVLVAAQTDTASARMERCENLVVGFFVGKRLSFAAVQLAVSKLWKFNKEVSIKLYSDCAFIFEFNDDEDRKKVLDTGSFLISNKLFTLKPWSHMMEKCITEVKSVPIWVLIYGVPLHMWDEEGLGLLSSYLGKPLSVDDCTINQDRLAFARVCIEIDVEFDYPEKIPLLIDGKFAFELPVVYQWKPHKCDVCRVFGQSTKACGKKKKTRWPSKKVCKPTVLENARQL
ncbi:uncharacterized protein LOC113335253 [Papaver somniferum]|uniref:uncharacterized protein LOC113335253 n=1 Tax=Papaver somniferum TaxID=3469 RepID=UPI000E7037CC|nr:uncharacterized protein LOC113335253 [Papaver somniferum]